MSGRRDSLPGKIINDLKKLTLDWQFGNSGSVHSVQLLEKPSLVFFSMGFFCETYPVDLTETPAPKVHPIPLTEAAPSVHSITSSIACKLASVGNACQVEPTVHVVRPMAQEPVSWHQITFDNLQKAHCQNVFIPPLNEKAHIKAWKFKEIAAKSIAWQIRSLETKAKAYQWGAFKAQVKEPRSPLLELPIVKAPVVLQELSRELSRQFRKALAEKGKTSYTNIEITLVYDRLNVKNFSSISPDGRGNLVCIPKGEMIGKNHPSRQKLLPAPGEDGSMMHYLVFGKRFDTQQPLRTMVAIPITGVAQLERVARIGNPDGPGTSGGRKS